MFTVYLKKKKMKTLGEYETGLKLICGKKHYEIIR